MRGLGLGDLLRAPDESREEARGLLRTGTAATTSNFIFIFVRRRTEYVSCQCRPGVPGIEDLPAASHTDGVKRCLMGQRLYAAVSSAYVTQSRQPQTRERSEKTTHAFRTLRTLDAEPSEGIFADCLFTSNTYRTGRYAVQSGLARTPGRRVYNFPVARDVNDDPSDRAETHIPVSAKEPAWRTPGN